MIGISEVPAAITTRPRTIVVRAEKALDAAVTPESRPKYMLLSSAEGHPKETALVVIAPKV